MLSDGMPVDLLHAAKSKQQRDATVDAFRIGKVGPVHQLIVTVCAWMRACFCMPML